LLSITTKKDERKHARRFRAGALTRALTKAPFGALSGGIDKKSENKSGQTILIYSPPD